ncbi:MAG: dihydrolipoamide acetyltransferase family protein [Planctomycetota bacterium]|nr:dihydrolipoamide acetyltransferase family protein [Planctomycetota bacterium]
MAVKEFKLPDIGEGIAEGEIVQWMVEPGQAVQEEDPFVEVMTDKATVTITVPWSGTIAELKAAAGDIVPVESVIAVIDTAGDAPAPAAAPATEETTATPAVAAKTAAPAAVASPVAPTAVAFEQASPGKVLAAPATRKRAREMSIDLHAIAGTGPSGRVTNEDLQAYVDRGGAVDSPAAAATMDTSKSFTPVAIAAAGTEERVPFVGLRRKIAEAMARSKYTATHFSYVDDINVTELVKIRTEAKAMYADQGVNITYLPFIMQAAVKAMKQFPTMNSSLDETTNELVVKHYYNFGIATDTDNGLVVPVIRDVDKKSIVELAFDIQELARKSREGSLGVDDLQNGTFTLTNAGNIGGLFATPVINFPEVSIMGVHKIKKTPVVNNEGEVVVGDVMYLSLSIDHRIVDGATGARWMNVVKDLLETPQRLLLGSL